MEDVSSLITWTREGDPSFYRNRWGNVASFSQLSSVGREDFIQTPLSQRRYKESRSFVKIVRDGDSAFLSEWGFEDIASEAWGLPSQRPMVYLSDPHEALEKSLWCYERDMVPLIGEKDPALAMLAARAYHIDSLITDPIALMHFSPYFTAPQTQLSSISILCGSFDILSLLPFVHCARRVRLVLALPETGAYAEATLSERPIFTALPGCIVEQEGGIFLITKNVRLVTPILRYRLNPSSAVVFSGL
jgi:hypothetical protein